VQYARRKMMSSTSQQAFHRSRKHQDLQVWQLETSLIKGVYAATKRFPDFEKLGLCSQMQCTAVSIPSNITEGAARRGNKEFLQLPYTARGTLN